MKHAALKRNMIKWGLLGVARGINKTPRVLFYHGVDHIINPSVQTLHISPDIFYEEMLYLAKYYEVISMDEYYRRWKDGNFKGKEVVVTFDDGYRNNLTVAAPVLKSLNMPFTVFVSVNHIDKGKLFPTFTNRAVLLDEGVKRIRIDCLDIDVTFHSDGQRRDLLSELNYTLKHSCIEKVNLICEQLMRNLSDEQMNDIFREYSSDVPMNWVELAELAKVAGCTIGSHCLDHFICNSYQTQEETRYQITESRKIIQEKLNVNCDYMAYPNGNIPQGDISDCARKAVEDAGYKMAFTTMPVRLGKRSDPFLLPRCAARFELIDFKVKLALKPGFK